MKPLGKKFINKIIDGTVEVLRDSAKQVVDTVAPDKLLEQAVGTPHRTESDFTRYLQESGGNLSAEEIKKKREEFGLSDSKGMEDARKAIQAAIPDHMRAPESSGEPSVYEQNVRQEEQKKAQAVEAQKKQPKAISAPAGKTGRGSLGKTRRPKSSDFEASKNIKVG